MFDITRRKLVGAALLGTGAVLGGLGLSARADTLTTKGRIMLDAYPTPPRGLVEAATFPLIEAIHGRRSRRFAKGATIPDGPLAFTSRQAPEPLDPLEQMLLLATVVGQHRLGRALRAPSRICGEAAELHHRRGRAELSRPRRASTPRSSSSPTTAASTSCRRGT